MDVRAKFLAERKKNVEQAVAKVQEEYSGLVDYLNGLLQQVKVTSTDLLSEMQYDSFVKKAGPAFAIFEEILSKMILIRLSLPVDVENGDTRPDAASSDAHEDLSPPQHHQQNKDIVASAVQGTVEPGNKETHGLVEHPHHETHEDHTPRQQNKQTRSSVSHPDLTSNQVATPQQQPSGCQSCVEVHGDCSPRHHARHAQTSAADTHTSPEVHNDALPSQSQHAKQAPAVKPLFSTYVPPVPSVVTSHTSSGHDCSHRNPEVRDHQHHAGGAQKINREPKSARAVGASKSPVLPTVSPASGCAASQTVSSDRRDAVPGPWISVLPKYMICERVLCVNIVEVHTPWLFWAQVQTSSDLDDIIDKLDVFHGRYKFDDPKYQLDLGRLRVGMLVSCLFNDGKWYRARIVTTYTATGSPGAAVNRVNILYIDFGNFELDVKVIRLRPLPDDMLVFPCQAFPCTLNKIAPLSTDRMLWTEPVCTEFNEFVSGDGRYIRIEDVSDCSSVFVDIFKDLASANSVHAGSAWNALVGNGRAREVLDNEVTTNWYHNQNMSQTYPGCAEYIPWASVLAMQKPEIMFGDSSAAIPIYHVQVASPTLKSQLGQPYFKGGDEVIESIMNRENMKLDRIDQWVQEQIAQTDKTLMQLANHRLVPDKDPVKHPKLLTSEDSQLDRLKIETKSKVLASNSISEKHKGLGDFGNFSEPERDVNSSRQPKIDVSEEQVIRSTKVDKRRRQSSKAQEEKARARGSSNAPLKADCRERSGDRTIADLDSFSLSSSSCSMERRKLGTGNRNDGMILGGLQDSQISQKSQPVLPSVMTHMGSEETSIMNSCSDTKGHGGNVTKNERKGAVSTLRTDYAATQNIMTVNAPERLNGYETAKEFMIRKKPSPASDVKQGREKDFPSNLKGASVAHGLTKPKLIFNDERSVRKSSNTKNDDDLQRSGAFGHCKNSLPTLGHGEINADNVGAKVSVHSKEDKMSSMPTSSSSIPLMKQGASETNVPKSVVACGSVNNSSSFVTACSSPNLGSKTECSSESSELYSLPLSPQKQACSVTQGSGDKLDKQHTLDSNTIVSTTPPESIYYDPEESSSSDDLSRSPPLLTLCVPDDHRFHVAVSDSSSPGRFWVHVVNNVSPLLDTVQEKLEQYVKTSAGLTVLDHYKIGTFCVARNPSDGCYYRGEIADICYGDTNCQRGTKDGLTYCTCDQTLPRDTNSTVLAARVHFIDYGGLQWVDLLHLWYLPSDLAELPPFCVCCCLDNVEPADVNVVGNWSDEAKEFFRFLTMNNEGNMLTLKLVYAYIDIDLPPGVLISPSLRKPLSVTLVDESFNPPVNINEQLVEGGYAIKVRDDQKLFLNAWNPMADDYLSERNSYQIDTDDPGVATVNYSAKDEQRICRFYNMRGGCWKGDLCLYEHIRTSDIRGITSDRQAVYHMYECETQVDLPETGSWVLVQVTHIFTPNHFCICFPYGMVSYGDLLDNEEANSFRDIMEFHEDLHAHYSRKVFSNSDLTLFGYGELVAARCASNERWYRAKVIGRDSENNVKVLYVDYGNYEWLGVDRIRQMEPKFVPVPIQAVHCYLPLSPKSGTATWSAEAKEKFESLVNDKILSAKILRIGADHKLLADLYSGDDNIAELMVRAGLATKSSDMIVYFVETHSQTQGHSASNDSSSPHPFLIPG